MAIEINSNIPSLRADRQISKRHAEVDRGFERLSTGKRINRASDDPAGLAVAASLLADADTGAVAARNISDGVSVANIAEGAIDSASQITNRLAELSAQASNGTLSDSQRSALNQEYQGLRSELDRISQTTEFNGLKLLSNNSTVTIQAGVGGGSDSQISVGLPSVSASALNLPTDISTQANAQAALDQARAATQSLASSRGDLGAAVSRLGTAYENLKTAEVNSRESASRIVDADYAEETGKLTAARIALNAATAVKAQANQQSNLVLGLLS